MVPPILHLLFKIFKMKLYLIISSIFICSFNSFGQVIPHAFIPKKVYSPTSNYSNDKYNGAFRFNYNRTAAPRIENGTAWSFNQTTPYTIQFEVQLSQFDFNHAADGQDYSWTIPLFGFTNGQLSSQDAIMVFSYNINYKKGNYSQGHSLNITNKGIYFPYNPTIDNFGFRSPFNGAFHFTITYDGSRWRFYKNGIKISEYNNVYNWSGSGKLVIGSTYTITKENQPKFIFDEFRFWDKVLSDNEISNNWNKDLTGNESGLKIYYNFNDQGHGNTNNTQFNYVKDRSPNNNNGSLINTELIGDENNFISEEIFSKGSLPFNKTKFNFSGIYSFDAINADCYPGTNNNKNNNPLSNDKIYNLGDFNNNLQFYTNTNYNQLIRPFYHLDAGRSFGFQDMYGKSNYNSNIAGSNPITIEAWVKFNASGNMSIASLGEENLGKLFELALYDNKLNINLGDPNYYVLASTAIVKNVWYHVVCVFDGQNNYTIYVNGQKEGEAQYGNIVNSIVNGELRKTSSFQNTTNTPLYLGKSQRPFNSKLGILNVYNRALLSAEILHKYNATKSRFGY